MFYDDVSVASYTPPPQPGDDIFVSEYGEGPSGTASWGKYLEIANFTGADVSLDGYLLGGITNGGDAYEKFVTFTAGATIANGDVWVIGRAADGDGSPESLWGQVDQVDNDVTHNGDDAWHLLKGTESDYTLVDAAIGDAGSDPGTHFTICGTGETRNSSWVKKPGKGGASSWAVSAGTTADDCYWTEVAQSADSLDYSTVGNHTFSETTPEPTPAAIVEETMESFSADSENLSPWVAYINQFDSAGSYTGGYSVSPAPNGPQISAFATGEEGANNGTGYLNAYSNYDDGTHASGIVETNLYRELTITSDMVGTVTWAFDVKRPAGGNECGGTNSDNSATGGVCKGFIKILDPASGYATTLFETIETTAVATDAWAQVSVTATVAEGDVGKLIQFGFQNTASNYAPTGVYYDNMSATVSQ
tara:strand:- start:462 stop:1721 length:1260 start_codon:yes stop_codon:yes gene_type:complete